MCVVSPNEIGCDLGGAVIAVSPHRLGQCGTAIRRRLLETKLFGRSRIGAPFLIYYLSSGHSVYCNKLDMSRKPTWVVLQKLSAR